MNAVDALKRLIRLNQKIQTQIDELKYQMTASQSPWLTIKEAAAYAGYTEHYFYRIYQEMPYFQRNKSIMIRRDDLEAWMQKNKKAPTAIRANH